VRLVAADPRRPRRRRGLKRSSRCAPGHTALQPRNELPEGTDALYRQRGRDNLLRKEAVIAQLRFCDPDTAWIAVRQLHHEPDVAVPTVRLLGTQDLANEGVTPACQPDITRQTSLNLLQSVVHSKEGSGLEHIPSGDYDANGAWLQCAVLAHNLMRWTTTIGQPAPVDQLTVARTTRLRLINIPGRVVNRSGRPTLRGPLHWPWAQLLTRRLAALRALPAPG